MNFPWGRTEKIRARGCQMLATAIAVGLSVDEAVQLVATDIAIAEVIRANPGRADEIIAESNRAVEMAVRAVSARRAA